MFIFSVVILVEVAFVAGFIIGWIANNIIKK